MIKLIEQLEAEGKRLLAISDRYIMVHWEEDHSYVIWLCLENTNGKYVFECGKYFPENTSEEALFLAFYEAVANV